VTVTGSAAANTQDGDNDLEAAQTTDASSGDGVGGQVVGVVTAGDTAIDATNRSSDVDVITGDATSANDSDTFAGLLGGDAVTAITQSNEVALTDSDDNTVTQTNTATVTDVTAANVQDGDNQTRLTQTADASSGDGVGGQIIGAVTSARGSADVDMANTSTDLDVQTGETGRTNFAVLFVGLVTGNAGAGP